MWTSSRSSCFPDSLTLQMLAAPLSPLFFAYSFFQICVQWTASMLHVSSITKFPVHIPCTLTLKFIDLFGNLFCIYIRFKVKLIPAMLSILTYLHNFSHCFNVFFGNRKKEQVSRKLWWLQFATKQSIAADRYRWRWIQSESENTCWFVYLQRRFRKWRHYETFLAYWRS